jgi:hypothetical protein
MHLNKHYSDSSVEGKVRAEYKCHACAVLVQEVIEHKKSSSITEYFVCLRPYMFLLNVAVGFCALQ